MRGLWAAALAAILTCGLTSAARAGVKAWLDASQVAEGDTVQLTIEHQGHTSGQPDLAPLQRDFDILGTSTRTDVQIVNGSFSESTDVELTLAPKRAGKLTVPPISWDGERTRALALAVTGPGASPQAGAAGAPGGASIFIQTRIRPKDPYVQAAVRLTVRLFTAERLYRGDLELPGSADVIVRRIGSDEDSRVERNGRAYQEITRHYLLFPLHSGKLSLPGPVLDAEVAVPQRGSGSGMNPFRGFFGGAFAGAFGGTLQMASPVRVHGRAIRLAVRPRPASAMGSYWLPARKVTLSAHWDPADLATQAGNPVTLDLDLQATGLTAAQLPDLAALLHVPSGIKVYPDQAKLHDSTRNGTLLGRRDQSIALIADRAGRYILPPLELRWWDTAAKRLRVATLPAQTLRIAPAPAAAPAKPAAAAAPPARAPSAAASPPGRSRAGQASAAPARHAPRKSKSAGGPSWKWLSVALAALWLLTLLGWLGSRRSKARRTPARDGPDPAAAPKPDPAAARTAFLGACRRNDALAARRHLLAWAAALWGARPQGLNAIAARTGDARTAELLRDLDRACYVGGDWSGQALAEALTRLPGDPAGKARGPEPLAPLYR